MIATRGAARSGWCNRDAGIHPALKPRLGGGKGPMLGCFALSDGGQAVRVRLVDINAVAEIHHQGGW